MSEMVNRKLERSRRKEANAWRALSKVTKLKWLRKRRLSHKLNVVFERELSKMTAIVDTFQVTETPKRSGLVKQATTRMLEGC